MATLLLTLLIFVVLLGLFIYVVNPIYRVNAVQIIVLFDQVLAGKATVSDWLVFTAVPLRHDQDLEEIRKQCAAMEETELLGSNSKYLFTAAGLAFIRSLREQLINLRDS